MTLRRIIHYRLFWIHITAAISACAALLTLLTVLFNLDWIKSCFGFGFIGVIIVILTSSSYACWQIYSKKEISLTFSSNLKLTIKEGDLFNQKGIICIPVNEYFDTHVGDGVVSEKSIHGIFINKYFHDRIQELRQKIQEKLAKNTPLINYEEHSRRLKDCPTKRYPLGTCIDIREGENTYVLFALTHFDENDKAYVSRKDYSHVENELMKHLTNVAEDKPVFMPLFGAALSRIQRTPQRILFQLVALLDFDDTNIIKGGINIILKSLDEIDVNLSLMEDVIKRGIIE